MKPLKKFSVILDNDNSILESLTKTYGTGIVDLVKKLGYNSMEDIAKEKKLLSKLETLLKDLPKKSDISEDDAEEIEAADLKRGEPKSIESKSGAVVTKADDTEVEEGHEKDHDEDEDEDEEVGGAGVAIPKETGDGEETSDEIEAEIVDMGEPVAEPETKGETKVTPDEEITDDVPEEDDDPEAGKEVPIAQDEIEEEDDAVINDPENDNPEGYPPPAGLSDDVPQPEEVEADEVEAAKRIKTFEDFVAEDGDSSTSTVIKKVRYSDDAEEPEDYEEPIAASADPMAEDGDPEEEDAEEDEEHYKDAEEDDEDQEAKLKKDADYDKEKEKEAEDLEEDHLILSFAKFVDEKYDKGGEVEDNSKTDIEEEEHEDEDEPEEEYHEEEEQEDEDEDAVTEETAGMKVKPEALKDEESGEAGITIPKVAGDGSKSAAKIAVGLVAKGKPKKESEELGDEYVTKEQPIKEDPKTSPDKVGTIEGGKIVTSVPGSNVSEKLTKKQEKLPDALKKAILKKAGKTPDEIEESLSRINEKEITSDDEFKEYAKELLKKAHGDDYDEAKADDVINGLKDKYKGDYGAMVGALQSSMG